LPVCHAANGVNINSEGEEVQKRLEEGGKEIPGQFYRDVASDGASLRIAASERAVPTGSRQGRLRRGGERSAGAAASGWAGAMPEFCE